MFMHVCVSTLRVYFMFDFVCVYQNVAHHVLNLKLFSQYSRAGYLCPDYIQFYIGLVIDIAMLNIIKAKSFYVLRSTYLFPTFSAMDYHHIVSLSICIFMIFSITAASR